MSFLCQLYRFRKKLCSFINVLWKIFSFRLKFLERKTVYKMVEIVQLKKWAKVLEASFYWIILDEVCCITRKHACDVQKKNAGADNNCTEKASEKKKSPTLNCWMLKKKTAQNNQIKWDKLRKRPTNSI